MRLKDRHPHLDLNLKDQRTTHEFRLGARKQEHPNLGLHDQRPEVKRKTYIRRSSFQS